MALFNRGLNGRAQGVALVAFTSTSMPRIKLSRREWALFLFPCSLLLFGELNNVRGLEASRLELALNPFASAREKSRRASCQSNLKQLSLAMLQYMEDYNGHFPINTSATCNWVPALMPYGYYYNGQDGILHCPCASIRSFMQPDYWMNSNLNDAKGAGLSQKAIQNTSRTFVFGGGEPVMIRSPFVLNEKNWSAKPLYVHRHWSGANNAFGANYAFVDGHVKWYSAEDISADQFKSPDSSLHSWKLK